MKQQEPIQAQTEPGVRIPLSPPFSPPLILQEIAKSQRKNVKIGPDRRGLLLNPNYGKPGQPLFVFNDRQRFENIEQLISIGRQTADRTGKTMVRVVEDLVLERSKFKKAA